MTTWNIGGGLVWVSLGLTTVEPLGFSAMARMGGRSTRSTSGSLSGETIESLIWTSGRAFSRPFNRLWAPPIGASGELRCRERPFFALCGALLTLPDTPRKKRLGVWFQAFRIAL